MTVHPNTVKRVAAGIATFAAFLVAFAAALPQDAATPQAYLLALGAAGAAVWHPKPLPGDGDPEVKP